MFSSLIFCCAEGVPSHIKKASFLWQRGPKLQYTDLAERTTDGYVNWDQSLKQVILISLVSCCTDQIDVSVNCAGDPVKGVHFQCDDPAAKIGRAIWFCTTLFACSFGPELY